MDEMQYLCRSALGDGRWADWYLLAGMVPAGRFVCESYGLRMEIPGGAAVSVPGISCSRAAVAALLEDLMARQVPPEELAAAAAVWQAQESSASATRSATCSTAPKST